MSSILRAACTSLAVTLTALSPFAFERVALAQEVQAVADRKVAEVGVPFVVQLSAQSENGVPENPKLTAPKGVVAQFQGGSPSRMFMNINGVQSVRNSLTATWAIVASVQGSFTFSPSVTIGGRTVASNVSVKVVPLGKAPQPQRQRRDPFGGLFGQDPFDDDFFNQPAFPGFQFEMRQPQVQTDPAFALPAPRGDRAFLHSTIDRKTAIVGEQVTLTSYIYLRADAGSFAAEDVHEARTPDFIARSLRDDNGTMKIVGQANVGGELWNVLLIRKVALFSLKTGDLKIDPMSLSVRMGQSLVVREGEAFNVRVTPPPENGKPPSYAQGDVGDWTITASVDPREVKRGGAVNVVFDLEGTGNLPASIVPPSQEGVEWLPPTITEKLTHTGDRSGGKRSFNYVVRFKKSGDVDLGKLEVPYYSPSKRRYEVSSAELGIIKVTPNGDESQKVIAADDPYRSIPPLKASLAGLGSQLLIADRPWFLYAVGLPPIGALLAIALTRASRKLASARALRKESPAMKLRRAIAEGDALYASTTDAALLERSVQLVLELAIALRTSILLRSIPRSEAKERLAKAGIDETIVARLLAMADASDEARFAPEAATLDEAKRRWKEVNDLARKIAKGSAP